MKKRPGISLVVMTAAVFLGTIIGITLFNQSLADLKKEESLQVTRDLNELIKATHFHYMRYINTAGEYIDSYDAAAPASMNNVIAAWSNGGGMFPIPSGNETLAEYVTRLGLDGDLSTSLFTGRFIEGVSIKSEIVSRVLSPAGLTSIPNHWAVVITVTSTGAGHFHMGTLRAKLINNNSLSAFGSSSHVTVKFLESSEKKVEVQLDYRILDNHSTQFDPFDI